MINFEAWLVVFNGVGLCKVNYSGSYRLLNQALHMILTPIIRLTRLKDNYIYLRLDIISHLGIF